MAVLGLLLFVRLGTDATYVADILPGIMLTSIGMGFVFVPVTLIATSGVPTDDAGLASGLYNTSQQVGGALGLAILSTFAANATDETLASAGGNPTSEQQSQALVDGFHVAWLGSIALHAGRWDPAVRPAAALRTCAQPRTARTCSAVAV